MNLAEVNAKSDANMLVAMHPNMLVKVGRWWRWQESNDTLHLLGCTHTNPSWWMGGDIKPREVETLAPGDDFCRRCVMQLVEKIDG